MTSNEVIVFGTGDFARTAAIYLTADSPYTVAAFTVNERFLAAPELNGIPVVPFESIEQSYPPERYSMFVAIGFSRVNRARREVYEDARRRGYQLVSYVSSQAQRVVEPEFGANCFVFEANVIQPNVRIGDDVILWSGNHIGHDVRIGDHCFIASHVVISGNVEIGESCFIGVNATLRDGVKVAADCIIGAGALIMKDTIPGGVYSVRGTEPLEKRSWDLRSF
jgi:sugar O-acyltransferase (sialic acid O-acetyltransferase NeuD family)